MGIRVGRKRVARLLQVVGRRGISHRHKRRDRPAAAVDDDLVQRRFVAAAPNRLWCTTSLSTRPGLGRSTAARSSTCSAASYHMRSDLVVDALQMAIWRRRPQATIVHADPGSQYTSWVFGHRLRDAGLLGSMGRVASSVDDSMIESFWSTVQRELLDTRSRDHPRTSAGRSSNGSKPGTTAADVTPRCRCSPRHEFETLHTAAVTAA